MILPRCHRLPTVKQPQPRHVGHKQYHHEHGNLGRHIGQLATNAFHLPEAQPQECQDKVHQPFNAVVNGRHQMAVLKCQGKTQEKRCQDQQCAGQHEVLEKSVLGRRRSADRFVLIGIKMKLACTGIAIGSNGAR